MNIYKEHGKVCIDGCDHEFYDTLTDKEQKYVLAGDNWISKSMRQEKLKALRLYGYKLDDLDGMTEEQTKDIWTKAINHWNESIK